MGEINKQRAGWADQAVCVFQIVTGTDRDDAITDLLTDIMHLVDEEGGSFGVILERATTNYHGEVADDE